ncbi:cysteine dioxygenase family protein [Allopusillimonas ginsengisoli]|uniref:cysteine dioxygenase family protein n=1 Tax=Allopusillimonas ginsengisoli TaxID=453575 RepID=UPI001020572B|nr:cysteine dioxygenase family protein [Allopusillimonas ginsengisoli]TEA80097.1 cysteine dioxygenase [Allopusillimonas ginsengisoli]
MNADSRQFPARLASLVYQISSACEGAADVLPEKVKDILCEYGDIDNLLLPYQREGSASSYTRHLLHGDSKGRFTIVALVWSPGQKTPVHAHYTWCAYRVAEGNLQEERFSWDAAQKQVVLNETVARTCGDTGYGHAGMEQVHRLANVGTAPAISIHVYGVDAERISTHVNRLAQAA